MQYVAIDHTNGRRVAVIDQRGPRTWRIWFNYRCDYSRHMFRSVTAATDYVESLGVNLIWSKID